MQLSFAFKFDKVASNLLSVSVGWTCGCQPHSHCLTEPAPPLPHCQSRTPSLTLTVAAHLSRSLSCCPEARPNLPRTRSSLSLPRTVTLSQPRTVTRSLALSLPRQTRPRVTFQHLPYSVVAISRHLLSNLCQSMTEYALSLNAITDLNARDKTLIVMDILSDSDRMSKKLAQVNLSPRSRHKLTLLLLRISLIVIVILALTGSFWWTISITTSSRGHICHSYRRLQDQLVSDFIAIGELSQGPAKFRELDFCPDGLENFVPCYNVSESSASGLSDGYEYERHCEQRFNQNCLVSSPVNYRLPLRWPTGRDVIWLANVRISAQEVLSSGSLTKRMMMLDEDQISFRSDSLTSDSIEDYSHQIAEMIGLRSASNLVQAGVRTILDIGCGYGTFAAHLFSKEILTMCIAPYEASGSQVQLTLERGLPAMIGSLTTKQLPYPSLSYDMVHCAQCGIDWDQKDGLFLLEVDGVLRPGGYFVWTSPLTNAHNKVHQKLWNLVRDFSENLCWELLSQQDETFVWKKTPKGGCYFSRKPGSSPAVCSKGQDIGSPYYRALQSCIGGTRSSRWVPVQQRPTWPSRAKLNGLHSEDLAEESANWNSAISNYWTLLSPLIFSDHPKRPGDEYPSPPFNMLRNVLDMNARLGGFNAALHDTGKSVWVMNVVPTNGPNYLPLILDRGFVGVLHDWCEAFPTYPRTYDLVHADSLLTQQNHS